MQQNSREQYVDVAPRTLEENESPKIKSLIEQLDRDLKQTQRNTSKER